MSSLFAFKKKIVLSPGVVFRPFFLVCVLVCVPVLLHFFPACCSIVCCFLTRPVLLMSSRSLTSEAMVLFGVLLAVFLVGCEVIVIGVFVFGASCWLLPLWIMLVTLFLVSFPVSELVLLFQLGALIRLEKTENGAKQNRAVKTKWLLIVFRGPLNNITRTE
jgi:hypothetical protein